MKTIALFFLLSLTTSLLGQQSLNPNNVLTISKEGKKREFAYRTGQTIKCRLKDGTKARGTLYVYSDYLFIDDTKVNFHEIEIIRPINSNLISRQVGSMASSEFFRWQFGAPRNNLYWTGIGVMTLLNFTLFNRNKTFKTKKGWNLMVKEISPFDFQRRR